MRRTLVACLAAALLLAGCATLKEGETTVANEARKSQAEQFANLVKLIGEGKLRLNDELVVGPQDPSLPMTNVRVSLRRAPDPRVMLALVSLADMSRFHDPPTIADVLIALIGGAKEVALRGLDQLPWYWGFNALKTALNQRGYQVTAGDNGTIVLHGQNVDATRVATGDSGTVAIRSRDIHANRVGRDLNQGESSGSERTNTP